MNGLLQFKPMLFKSEPYFSLVILDLQTLTGSRLSDPDSATGTLASEGFLGEATSSPACQTYRALTRSVLFSVLNHLITFLVVVVASVNKITALVHFKFLSKHILLRKASSVFHLVVFFHPPLTCGHPPDAGRAPYPLPPLPSAPPSLPRLPRDCAPACKMAAQTPISLPGVSSCAQAFLSGCFQGEMQMSLLLKQTMAPTQSSIKLVLYTFLAIGSSLFLVPYISNSDVTFCFLLPPGFLHSSLPFCLSCAHTVRAVSYIRLDSHESPSSQQ